MVVGEEGRVLLMTKVRAVKEESDKQPFFKV